MRKPLQKTMKNLPDAIDLIKTPPSSNATTTVVLAKIIAPQGRDIHEILIPLPLQQNQLSTDSNSSIPTKTTLVSLLPRLRGVVWIKKGSIVVVQVSNEVFVSSDEQIVDEKRFSGEIIGVVNKGNIEELKSLGYWSPVFDEMKKQKPSSEEEEEEEEEILEEEEESDNDDDLFVNRNHMYSDSDDDEDEEEDAISR